LIKENKIDKLQLLRKLRLNSEGGLIERTGNAILDEGEES